MRYLYGDSKPFPPNHNFLRTLEVFMATAIEAVSLETKARESWSAATHAAVLRNAATQELQKCHRAMMAALHKSSSTPFHPHLQDYARQVGDFAAGIVEETRLSSLRLTEREQADARAEVQRLRIEVRDAVENLMVKVRIPILATLITLRLGDGQERTGSASERRRVDVHGARQAVAAPMAARRGRKGSASTIGDVPRR